ncbi:MAG: membrane-bound ClpP family serine protease [Sulfitobacter sp.]|jgi:membrane-bound ClpP family serine protease
MLLRLLITSLFFLTAAPVAAMDILAKLDTPGAPHPNRLHLKMIGEIIKGDARQLKEGLETYDGIQFREIAIYLDSPGGSLLEALKIAEILRSREELIRTDLPPETSLRLM